MVIFGEISEISEEFLEILREIFEDFKILFDALIRAVRVVRAIRIIRAVRVVKTVRVVGTIRLVRAVGVVRTVRAIIAQALYKESEDQDFLIQVLIATEEASQSPGSQGR